jgi:hypothetical protein
MAIAGRTAVELDWTKAANAESIDSGLRAKEVDTSAERFTGRRGLKASLGSQVFRARPHRTDELGSAGFDSSVHRHLSSIMARVAQSPRSKPLETAHFR